MKNHPAFDSQSLRTTTMNLQPTTPATAPVEDMAAPQNQIPSSHAQYAGRFEKKKIAASWRLLSHSPYFVGMKNCWVFLVYSSPKITACWCFPWTLRVGNHKIFKSRQSWEKNPTRKIKEMWGHVIGFCFGPWRQSVLKRCQLWFPNMFCHQKSQPIRLPPKKSGSQETFQYCW